MDLTEALLSIERELWTGGPEAYHRHLDESCLVAFTTVGAVMTREEVADTVEEGDRWRDLEIQVEGLARPSPDVALFTYLASAVREGEGGEAYRARVSSGYVNRDGPWKMVFHHQTPLAGR